MKRIINKSKKMKEVERDKEECIEELLRYMYVDLNKDIYNICEELNISYATAVNWLNLAGIYSRKLDIN